MVEELTEAGLVERIEPHKLMTPRGDRSGAVIEPYLTKQWYVRIAPLAAEALAAVESGRVRFIPENWDKTYYQWMRNIQDWCISRQLWWGHRIPAWYDEQGNVYVARSEAAARAAARAHHGADVPLRQDEDVLDTWFSSACGRSRRSAGRRRRRSSRVSIPPMCWSPASTSSSSGWPA